MFGYHNSNGITYQYYWTNPNNTTAWQRQKIDDVFYNWNTSYKTGIITPMNINHTNNKDSSIIDWSYTTNWWDSSTTRVGETTFWNWGTKLQPDQSNWSSALIQYGGRLWHEGHPAITNNVKILTFAHEIGHAVGLAHNDNLMHTIMYPTMDEMDQAYHGPYADDLYGVNALY